MENKFLSAKTGLEVIAHRLRNAAHSRARLWTNKDILNRRASLLIGPRGVGKTTFLLRSFSEETSFYLSLDNPLISGINFYEFADELFQSGYDTLICDEVHYLTDWSLKLKALYDAHPNKKIIATDSSSLILRKGLGDLSRRFVVEKISYLNFREYLYLKHNLLLPSISWEELTSKNLAKSCKPYSNNKINLQKEFKLYLSEGTRPFFMESDFKTKIVNTIDKIIYADIPFFLPETKERHLQLMKNVIGFIATSPIPVINVESLSKNWAVGKATVYNLLEVMSESGLIRIIPEAGKKGGTKGKKIFFGDPSVYSAYEGNLGNVRECFVAMAFESIGKKVFCPKDDQEGDFLVDHLLFEIGGKSKKKKKANFIIKDNIDTATPGIIPLWILGFLEERL